MNSEQNQIEGEGYDVTNISINSKSLHQVTAGEDNATNECQARLYVVPLSSHPGFSELLEQSPDVEYTNLSTNTTSLPLYQGVIMCDCDSNDDLYQVTGCEDNVTNDLQVRLAFVSSSSYPAFLELLKGSLDFEYTNLSTNITSLHSLYQGIDLFDCDRNNFYFTVSYRRL